MKTMSIVSLLVALAMPATAAVVHDESIHGDLSSNEAAPTPVVFAPGGNIIKGSEHENSLDRDYITFTIPADHTLFSISLLTMQPNIIAFAYLNSGSTSFIPSPATSGLFLSGIRLSQADIFANLMEYFDTQRYHELAALAESRTGGTYSFLMEHTLQTYGFEFLILAPVATDPSTWGKVKALYR